MYCPAQALTSTGATERALERHNLLCPRQDYTRPNLSETITLVESSRLAGLTAGTSRGHFARAPGILLFGTSAICGLRKQRDACRKEAQGITAAALDLRFQPRSAFYSSVSFDAFANSTPKGYANKAAAPTPYLPLSGDVCLLASKAYLSRHARGGSEGEAITREKERWAAGLLAPMDMPWRSKSGLCPFHIMKDGTRAPLSQSGTRRYAMTKQS